MSRYVVIDFNILEGDLGRYVHDDDRIVLPHALVSDLVGSDATRLKKHTELFPKWYMDRGDQIWVPHVWQALEEKERSPKSRTVGLAWRDDRSSHELRRSVRNSQNGLTKRLADFTNLPVHRAFEEKRKSFVEVCQGIVSSGILWHGRPDVRKLLAGGDFLKNATELIREPHWGLVLSLAPPYRQRYRTRRWQKALNVFPDVKAVGRMSRIMVWYAMELVAERTRRFENNLEDSEYAFTASYTKYLATNGARLKEMVRALFPDVAILEKRSG